MNTKAHNIAKLSKLIAEEIASTLSALNARINAMLIDHNLKFTATCDFAFANTSILICQNCSSAEAHAGARIYVGCAHDIYHTKDNNTMFWDDAVFIEAVHGTTRHITEDIMCANCDQEKTVKGYKLCYGCAHDIENNGDDDVLFFNDAVRLMASYDEESDDETPIGESDETPIEG